MEAILQSELIFDGGANIASVFVLGSNMFGYSLYRGDELSGLFAIATIEDIAFQCC